jgi:hypothetical protein
MDWQTVHATLFRQIRMEAPIVADFWIKIRTCNGDGAATDIVADLARAIRRAADHRPWKVAIAPSAEALRSLDEELALLEEQLSSIDSPS